MQIHQSSVTSSVDSSSITKLNNMQSVIIFSILVAVAFCAPQAPTEPIPIVRQDSQINGDGSYQYSFETGNGISADQKGELKKVGDVESIDVTGQFQYPGEDGHPIQLTYKADENGYQPQSDILPTPPPIPAAIQRALAYLATAPPQPEQKQ